MLAIYKIGWAFIYIKKKVPSGVRLKPTRRRRPRFLSHKCPWSRDQKPRPGVWSRHSTLGVLFGGVDPTALSRNNRKVAFGTRHCASPSCGLVIKREPRGPRGRDRALLRTDRATALCGPRAPLHRDGKGEAAMSPLSSSHRRPRDITTPPAGDAAAMPHSRLVGADGRKDTRHQTAATRQNPTRLQWWRNPIFRGPRS